MTAAVCAAVLAVLLFAAVAPRLGRRLPPAPATRLLVPASLLVAASTVFVLGVLAITWLGQLPVVAAVAAWSPGLLSALDPVPEPLAVASFVLLVVLAVRVGVRVVRRGRALVSVRRIHQDRRTAGALVVLESARPEAFTTPAPSARVVVTSALLRALVPEELRVVLAHERSHVAHRHVWWTLAADLAAAVNPLLRPTATTIGHAVERWADEDAAETVGDRRLVARTIARAALLRHDAPGGSGDVLATGATGGDVPRRVRALLAPPPRRRPFVLAALAVVLVAGALATVAVEATSDQVFDHAALPAASHHVPRHRHA